MPPSQAELPGSYSHATCGAEQLLQSGVRLHCNLGLIFFTWALTLPLFGQSTAAGDGNQLVRTVIQNELKASDADHSHWTYRLEKQDDTGAKQTRQIIDTVNGSIYRLVAVNGKPLDPQQQQAEDERLEKYIHDTEAQQKKEKSRKDDADKAKQMLKMLPEAFIYTREKEEANLVFLRFTPNPKFDPPNREAQVFHAMEGTMVLDRREDRLVKLSGRLMDDVTFGWGILGRLQKGGTFVVEQTEVSPGIWLNKTLDVNMHGKAVLFKTINVQQHEFSSDFRRVPDNLSLAQAAQRLEEETRMSNAQASAANGPGK